MTRIAYVCADPGVPIFGRKGCSIHVQEVVRAFSRAGHDVELFAARVDGDAPMDLADVRVCHLPSKPSDKVEVRERELIAANAGFMHALRQQGPFDLIHERFSLWSYAGMEAARDASAPGLLEVNAPLIDEQAAHRALSNRGEAERLARRAFAAATRIVAVSGEVAQYLAQFAESRGKVVVVPNGVDAERIHPDVPPTVRTKGCFTVGFVGTLKPWHGVAQLIQAFAEFHRALPASRLLIVGDGPERAGLELDATQLGVIEHVRFTGAVNASDIPGLLTSIDVAVAPYPSGERFYFSPLKVYEYMAAGRAVVASCVGQICDVVTDGVNGMIVPPGDVPALAAALTKLCDDLALRQRLGSAARNTIVQSHTWNAVAHRLLSLAEESKTVAIRPSGWSRPDIRLGALL